MKTSHAFSRYKPTVFKKRRQGRQKLRVLRVLLFLYLLKFILSVFFFHPLRVESRSMLPTLRSGDRVLQIPLIYGTRIASWLRLPGLRKLQRGDLVLLRHPSYESIPFLRRSASEFLSFLSFGLFSPETSPYLIRRVIALPRDTVEVDRYVASVAQSGTLVSEFTLSLTPQEISLVLSEEQEDNISFLMRMPKKFVMQDEVFVLADNRREALDSRYLGNIPLSQIRGVIALRYFPFSRFEVFEKR